MRHRIALIVVTVFIEAPATLLTPMSDAWRYFLTGGRRKSASALHRAGRVLAPGGRRISVDDGTPKLVRDELALLAELAASGSLRPVIDRIYPLEGIVEAHRYVSGGHKRGNVIITVD